MIGTYRHSRFPSIIRVIACLLIITFISQDIVWANPDGFTKRDTQNTKLAPQSFFTESESVERAYGKILEQYIEGNGIPRDRLTLNAVKAALRKHKDESWFRTNVGFTESDHEVLISFSGYIIRYYDPTAVSSDHQKKYQDQVRNEAGLPAMVQLNPYLHKQLLRVKSLPAPAVPDRASKAVSKPAAKEAQQPIVPEITLTEDFAKASAAKVAAEIRAFQKKLPGKINLVVGHGNTMVGFLKDLATAPDIDWGRVNLLQLVEYTDVLPLSPFSFRSYLYEYFIDKMPAGNRIPDRNVYDINKVGIKRYKELLGDRLRPHIVVLGVGVNGHLGFNEPGTGFGSKARKVDIIEETVKSDMAGKPILRLKRLSRQSPTAYTMGMAEIASADRIFLLANGEEKQDIVKKALRGPVTTSVPASMLQTMPEKVTVVLDEDAAAGFQEDPYASFADMQRNIIKAVNAIEWAGVTMAIDEMDEARFVETLATHYLGLVVSAEELRNIVAEFSPADKVIVGRDGVERFERLLQGKILDYFMAHYSEKLLEVGDVGSDRAHEVYRLFYKFAHLYKFPYIRDRVEDRRSLLAMFILANIQPAESTIGSRLRSDISIRLMADEIFLDKDPEISEFALATVIDLCAMTGSRGKYFLTHLLPLLKESESLPRFVMGLMDVVVNVERNVEHMPHIADKDRFFEIAAAIIKSMVADDLKHGKHYFTRKFLEYSYALVLMYGITAPAANKLYKDVENEFAEQIVRESNGALSNGNGKVRGTPIAMAGFAWAKIIRSLQLLGFPMSAIVSLGGLEELFYSGVLITGIGTFLESFFGLDPLAGLIVGSLISLHVFLRSHANAVLWYDRSVEGINSRYPSEEDLQGLARLAIVVRSAYVACMLMPFGGYNVVAALSAAVLIHGFYNVVSLSREAPMAMGSAGQSAMPVEKGVSDAEPIIVARFRIWAKAFRTSLVELKTVWESMGRPSREADRERLIQVMEKAAGIADKAYVLGLSKTSEEALGHELLGCMWFFKIVADRKALDSIRKEDLTLSLDRSINKVARYGDVLKLAYQKEGTRIILDIDESTKPVENGLKPGSSDMEAAKKRVTVEAKASAAFDVLLSVFGKEIALIRKYIEAGDREEVTNCAHRIMVAIDTGFAGGELAPLREALQDSLNNLYALPLYIVNGKADKKAVTGLLGAMDNAIKELKILQAAGRLMDSPKALVSSGYFDASRVLGKIKPGSSDMAGPKKRDVRAMVLECLSQNGGKATRATVREWLKQHLPEEADKAIDDLAGRNLIDIKHVLGAGPEADMVLTSADSSKSGASAAYFDPRTRMVLDDLRNEILPCMYCEEILRKGAETEQDGELATDLARIESYDVIFRTLQQAMTVYQPAVSNKTKAAGAKVVGIDEQAADPDAENVLKALSENITEFTHLTQAIRTRFAAGRYAWDPVVRDSVDEMVRHSDDILIPAMHRAISWFDSSMSVIDAGGFIEEEISDMEKNGSLAGREVILLDGAKQLKGVTISAYSMILRMGLKKLILNAAEHSGAKRIEIDASINRSGEIEVKVRDDGSSAPAEALDSILAAEHADAVNGKEKPGIQFIALKGAIESVGGSIAAETMAGQGSTFTFLLPITAPLNVTHKPRWAKPLVVAIGGLRGSGRRVISQWLAAKLGLKYINAGFIYRVILYNLLEERKDIDVNDEHAVAGFFESFLRSGRLDYFSEIVKVDGRDTEEPDPATGFALRDEIKSVIDKDAKNTTLLHKLSSYPDVQRVMEEYIKEMAKKERDAGRYGGIIRRVTEPVEEGSVEERDVINIMLEAPADIRARRAGKPASWIKRLDIQTEREGLEGRYAGILKINTSAKSVRETGLEALTHIIGILQKPIMKGAEPVKETAGQAPSVGRKTVMEEKPALPKAKSETQKIPAVQGAEKPIRILVVDDEAMLRQLNKTMLRFAGFKPEDIVLASNGEEGLAMFKEQGPFDIVLTDRDMPVMDGEKMAQAIRQEKDFGGKKAIIIMISGRSKEEKSIASILSDGTIDNFLQKSHYTNDDFKAVFIEARRAVQGLRQKPGSSDMESLKRNGRPGASTVGMLNRMFISSMLVFLGYQMISGSAGPVTLLVELAVIAALGAILSFASLRSKIMIALARLKPGVSDMEGRAKKTPSKLEDPLIKVILHDLKNKLTIFAYCDIILSRGEGMTDARALADLGLIDEYGDLFAKLSDATIGYFNGSVDIEKTLAMLNDSLPDLVHITKAINERLETDGFSWDPEAKEYTTFLVGQVSAVVIPLMQGAVSWLDRAMTPTDVEEAIKESIYIAKSSKTLPENVIVEVGVSDEVKHAQGLLTYRLILTMAIQELLRNAAKYSKTNRITLTASFFGTGELKINIRDYGTGILPKDMEKIFMPGVTEAADKRAGTGYGLPSLREALESVGGAIWAKSTYGRGALFTFTIPVDAPMNVVHRPRLSAPVIVSVAGLAGSGRRTISQYLAAKLGLCYINRGDIARLAVYHMLKMKQMGVKIDLNNAATTSDFVDRFLRSGKLSYSDGVLTVVGKDMATLKTPDGMTLRDSIKTEIDKNARNTEILHRVFSHPDAKKALDIFVESQAKQIQASGKYNGIVMKTTDPIMDDGVVNILLDAPAGIRAQRAKMELDRIEKLDIHTGKADMPETPYLGVRRIDTTAITHRIAESALLYVVSQLPAADREKLKSYLNWPNMERATSIKMEISSVKDHLKNRNYKDMPHEKLVLEGAGKKITFTMIGSFGKHSYGGEHLNVAVEDATGDLYVIKKLVTEEMERHCERVPEVMEITNGHRGIYQARLMSAGTGKWAGLEEASAIVYPYVRGHDFMDYKVQYKGRPLAEYVKDLFDIVIQVADTCEFLESKNVPGVWDIKSENIIITDDKKPVLIDYTSMTTPYAVEPLEFLLYDSFDGVFTDGIKVEGVLKKLQFVADPELNKEIVARLAEIHKNVKAQNYKHIKEFNDDLKSVRKLFDPVVAAPVVPVKPGESNMAALRQATGQLPLDYEASQPADISERLEEKLAVLVAMAESSDNPIAINEFDLKSQQISWDEAASLVAAANEEWMRIGSSRRFLAAADTRTLETVFSQTDGSDILSMPQGFGVFSETEQDLWKGAHDGLEVDINPQIRRYIEKGRAVEILEDGSVVRIRRNRSNPRSPPIESRFAENGILDKLRKARDPVLLTKIMKAGKNFRNLDAAEQERLVSEAMKISLSVILGKEVVYQRMRNGTLKDIYAHMRQGYTKYIHGLEPTMWIGEKLLNSLSPEQLARILLEESQHLVRPFEKLKDGRVKGLHKRDYPKGTDPDPKIYIEHDEAFKNELDNIVSMTRSGTIATLHTVNDDMDDNSDDALIPVGAAGVGTIPSVPMSWLPATKSDAMILMLNSMISDVKNEAVEIPAGRAAGIVKTVLFVDYHKRSEGRYESDIRSVFPGAEVISVNSPDEALKILHERGSDIGLVVTNLHFADAEEIHEMDEREQRANSAIVLLSAMKMRSIDAPAIIYTNSRFFTVLKWELETWRTFGSSMKVSFLRKPVQEDFVYELKKIRKSLIAGKAGKPGSSDMASAGRKAVPIHGTYAFARAKRLRKGDAALPVMVAKDHDSIVEWLKYLQKEGIARKDTTIINFDTHADAIDDWGKLHVGSWVRWAQDNGISTGRRVWVASGEKGIFDRSKPEEERYAYGNDIYRSIKALTDKVSGPAVITIDYDYIAPTYIRRISKEEIERKVRRVVDALFEADIQPIAINFTYSNEYLVEQHSIGYGIPPESTENMITKAFLDALNDKGYVIETDVKAKPGSSDMEQGVPGLPDNVAEAIEKAAKDDDMTQGVREIEHQCVYQVVSDMGKPTKGFGIFFATPTPMALRAIHYLKYTHGPKAKLCDLGSGNGAFCFFASPHFSAITGIEAVPEFVAAAIKNQKELVNIPEAGKPSFLNADFLDESTNLSSYDALYFFYTKPARFKTNQEFADALRAKLLSKNGMKSGATLVVLGAEAPIGDGIDLLQKVVKIGPTSFSVYTRAAVKPGSSDMERGSEKLKAESVYKDFFETLFEFNLKLFVLMARRMRAKRISDQAALVSAKNDTLKCLVDLMKEMDDFEARLKTMPQDIRMIDSYKKARQEFTRAIDLIAKDNEPAANAVLVAALNVVSRAREDIFKARMSSPRIRINVFKKDGKIVMRQQAYVKADANAKTLVPAYIEKAFDLRWQAGRSLDDQEDSVLDERQKISEYLAVIDRYQAAIARGDELTSDNIGGILYGLTGALVEEKRLARIALDAAGELIELGEAHSVRHLLPIARRYLGIRVEDIDNILRYLRLGRIEPFREIVIEDNAGLIARAKNIEKLLGEGQYKMARGGAYGLMKAVEPYMTEPDLEGLRTALGPVLGYTNILMKSVTADDEEFVRAKARAKFWAGLVTKKLTDSQWLSEFMEAFRTEYARRRISAPAPYLKEDTFIDVFGSFIKDKQLIRGSPKLTPSQIKAFQILCYLASSISMGSPVFEPVNTLRLMVEVDDIPTILKIARLQKLSATMIVSRAMQAKGAISNLTLEERIQLLKAMAKDFGLDDAGRFELSKAFAINKTNLRSTFPVQPVKPASSDIEAVASQQTGHSIDTKMVTIAGREIPVVVKEDMHPGLLAPQEVIVPNFDNSINIIHLGNKALDEGTVAVVSLAGGMSSRAGIDYPKGMHPIMPLSEKTLFRARAEELSAMKKAHGKPVVWFIMTSAITDAATQKYFAENGYFGLGKENVIFFGQRSVPVLESGSANVAMKDKDTPLIVGGGHGEFYDSMREASLRTDGGKISALEEARRRGIESFLLCNIDNPMPVVDPLVLGYHLKNSSNFTTVVVRKRDASEGLGMMAVDTVTGKPFFVEYNQPAAEAIKGRPGFEFGSINRFVFSRYLLESVTLPPYYRIEGKKARIYKDGTMQDALIDKFESLIFAVQAQAGRTINIYRDRSACFAAFKAFEGPDSPQAVAKAMSDLYKDWLGNSHVAAAISAASTLELAPAFALSPSDAEGKIGPGLRIAGASTVYLGGNDIRIGKNVHIHGAKVTVEFDDPYDGSLEIADDTSIPAGADVKIFVKKGEKVVYDGRGDAITKAEIRAAIDEIAKSSKGDLFTEENRRKFTEKVFGMKLRRGASVLVVGPGGSDYFPSLLSKLGMKIAVIDTYAGAVSAQERVHARLGLAGAIQGFTSYDDIKDKKFDYVFMLAVLHNAVQPTSDAIAAGFWNRRLRETDPARLRVIEQEARSYFTKKIEDTMIPILEAINPDGGYLLVNDVTPYSADECKADPVKISFSRRQLEYLDEAVRAAEKQGGIVFARQPINIDDFSMFPNNEWENRRSVVYRLERTSAKPGSSDMEAPQKVQPTILVVDDTPEVRKLLNKMLTTKGYAVILKNDAKEALEYISTAQVQPSAVLTDLNMPSMDGVAFAKELRKIGVNIPIVIHSNSIEDAHVVAEIAPGETIKINEKGGTYEGLRELYRIVPTVKPEKPASSDMESAVSRKPITSQFDFKDAKWLRKGNEAIPVMVSEKHDGVVALIPFLQTRGLADKATTVINLDTHSDAVIDLYEPLHQGSWVRWIKKNGMASGRCVWVKSGFKVRGDRSTPYDEKDTYGNDIYASIEEMSKKVSGPAIISIDYDFIAPKEGESLSKEKLEAKVHAVVDALLVSGIKPVALHFAYSPEYLAPSPLEGGVFRPRTETRVTEALLKAFNTAGFVFETDTGRTLDTLQAIIARTTPDAYRNRSPESPKAPPIDIDELEKAGYWEGQQNFYALIKSLGLERYRTENYYQNDLSIQTRADEILRAVGNLMTAMQGSSDRGEETRVFSRQITTEDGIPGIDIVVADNSDGTGFGLGKEWAFVRKVVFGGGNGTLELETAVGKKREVWKDSFDSKIFDSNLKVGIRIRLTKIFPDMKKVAGPSVSEDTQRIARIHGLFQVGLAGKSIKDGTKILLSENLFVKDGDERDLVQIRIALGSLLQSGNIAIMKPEEMRRAALNKDVTKEKMAIVFTKEDFENKDIWSGSDKETSLRSSVLILGDKMTGNNYLYLEGVIGLARAVMARNRQAISEYYKLISGVAIDDQILHLLKDDDQNNVAFAIKAILRFRPISMIVDSEEFNKTRIAIENALISA